MSQTAVVRSDLQGQKSYELRPICKITLIAIGVLSAASVGLAIALAKNGMLTPNNAYALGGSGMGISLSIPFIWTMPKDCQKTKEAVYSHAEKS